MITPQNYLTREDTTLTKIKGPYDVKNQKVYSISLPTDYDPLSMDSQIRQELRQYPNQHKDADFELDFEEREFISSSLLASLIVINIECIKNKRRLKIKNLSPLVRGTLQRTKLDTILEIES